jgi:hypothetical protein
MLRAGAGVATRGAAGIVVEDVIVVEDIGCIAGSVAAV